MQILGNPPAAIRDGLLSVIEGALTGGAAEPTWVAVDDGGAGWFAPLAATPAAERLRAVVAVGEEASLVSAIHLGVGGAVWLPPSSLGVLEALEAAASPVGETPCCEVSLVQVFESRRRLRIVSFSDPEFWRAQLGSRALERMLSVLAFDLGVAPAILAWPALLVGEEVAADRIRSYWKQIVGQEARAIPGLSLNTLDVQTDGVLGAAYRVLLQGESEDVIGGTQGLLPVHELPGGRRIGWWSTDAGDRAETGWTAQPVIEGGEAGRWVLDGEPSSVVDEVRSSDELDALENPYAVRVPGWACRDLRPGTPAGLLVTRLAETAARRNVPLWIPNLEHEGLHFALCLPGTLWVDGPAVPR